MRVVIVGDAPARARLRQQVGASPLDIIGEASTVAAARIAHPDAEAFLLVPEAPAGSRFNPEALTPRELEVLQVLAEGLPNKAIARRLGISDQTVKFHLAAICGKLGAQNRTDAVRLAIQRGLITV
jgi:DNA-binding NarL/FixJ family response regulator